jgi:hypothetical protein
MELKVESRAESGFPQGTLLPNIRSPGQDEADRSTIVIIMVGSEQRFQRQKELEHNI